MSINSFMFKRIMMWVITVFLVLCLVHNLFAAKPEINGDALNEIYNISKISEEEALIIIKDNEIENVVFDNVIETSKPDGFSKITILN